METKIRCPFIGMFDIICVYKGEGHICEDVAVCPGNGDSWCMKMLATPQNSKGDSADMPHLMTLATERPDPELYRVLINEPFPALNTTDAFLADKRTVLALLWMFKHTKTGLEIVVTYGDRTTAMAKELPQEIMDEL